MNKQVQNHKTPALFILLEGFKLLLTPGLKRYVAVPLIIGTLLFASLFTWMSLQIGSWQSGFEQWLNANLWQWLASTLSYASWLFWPVFIISAYLLFAYTLVSLVNIIAAPFNALLSEKVEELLGLPQAQNTNGISGFLQSIPRTVFREIRKFISTLKWLILLIVLLFIPVLNIFSLLIGAWLMAIQYLDIPADNHQLGFIEFLKTLKKRRFKALAFGLSVSLVSMLPLVNLILVPAAICAATLLWHQEYQL